VSTPDLGKIGDLSDKLATSSKNALSLAKGWPLFKRVDIPPKALRLLRTIGPAWQKVGLFSKAMPRPRKSRHISENVARYRQSRRQTCPVSEKVVGSRNMLAALPKGKEVNALFEKKERLGEQAVLSLAHFVHKSIQYRSDISESKENPFLQVRKTQS
jgi:hypothetical protein